MKKLLLLGFIGLILIGCDNKKGAFLETIDSQNSASATITKLIKTIEAEGLTYFETINHAKNAKDVGLRLTPKSVVVFGNPHLATALMKCNPSIGLDLPLKILISSNYDGKTTLTYTNPEYWTLKHNIKDKKCLAIINKVSINMQKITEKITK